MLDGLRGIAALWVACFHIFETSGSLKEFTPTPLSLVLGHGYLGVPIFFVLSGFAIAWSVRGARLGARGVGRFLLRRSLRLDPPYWATILLAILTAMVSNALLRDRVPVDLPSAKTILLHVFYLPDLVGQPKLVEAFWTLFQEMQFYLFFVLQLWLAQSLRRAEGALFVFLPGFAASLIVSGLMGHDLHGVCLPYWSYYALGVLLAWNHEGHFSTTWVCVALGLSVAGFAARPTSFAAAAITTAVLILVASRAGRLGSWLRSPILQYLGKISYSLYLVHQVVGQRGMNLFARLLGHSPTAALTSSLLGLAASIAAAHVMWWSVERPSLWLARRIPLRATH